MPNIKHSKFHNAKFDSLQTSELLKFIEQNYDIDMESEEVVNKIFGWHPICEYVIDREELGKNFKMQLNFFLSN